MPDVTPRSQAPQRAHDRLRGQDREHDEQLEHDDEHAGQDDEQRLEHDPVGRPRGCTGKPGRALVAPGTGLPHNGMTNAGGPPQVTLRTFEDYPSVQHAVDHLADHGLSLIHI